MGDEKHLPCSDNDVANSQVDNCRMPVLFHRATAVQVLDEEVDDGREVMVLPMLRPLPSSLDKIPILII